MEMAVFGHCILEQLNSFTEKEEYFLPQGFSISGPKGPLATYRQGWHRVIPLAFWKDRPWWRATGSPELLTSRLVYELSPFQHEVALTRSMIKTVFQLDYHDLLDRTTGARCSPTDISGYLMSLGSKLLRKIKYAAG